MSRIIFSIFFLFSVYYLPAQSIKRNTGTAKEYTGDIRMSPDGFGIASNSHDDTLNYSVSLYKYNKSGDMIWSRHITPVPSVYFVQAMCRFGAGGVSYLFDFMYENLTYPSRTAIIKFDSLGYVIWARQLICNQFITVSPNDLVECPNGDILVAGVRNQNGTLTPFLAKINASGNLLWVKETFDFTSNFHIDPVTPTTYILSGSQSSIGPSGLVLIDENGTVLWSKTITAGIRSTFYNAPDSSFYLFAGGSNTVFGITRISSSGSIINSRRFYFTTPTVTVTPEFARNVPGKGILISGTVQPDGTSERELMIGMINHDSLMVEFTKRIKIPFGFFFFAGSDALSNGKIVSTGSLDTASITNHHKVFFNMTDSLLFSSCHDSTLAVMSLSVNELDSAFDFHMHDTTVIYTVNNFTYELTTGYDDEDICHLVGIEKIFLPESHLIITPSIARDEIKLYTEDHFAISEVVIVDAVGKIVYASGNYSGSDLYIDCSQFISGIYFVRCLINDNVSTARFIRQ